MSKKKQKKNHSNTAAARASDINVLPITYMLLLWMYYEVFLYLSLNRKCVLGNYATQLQN